MGIIVIVIVIMVVVVPVIALTAICLTLLFSASHNLASSARAVKSFLLAFNELSRLTASCRSRCFPLPRKVRDSGQVAVAADISLSLHPKLAYRPGLQAHDAATAHKQRTWRRIRARR